MADRLAELKTRRAEIEAELNTLEVAEARRRDAEAREAEARKQDRRVQAGRAHARAAGWRSLLQHHMSDYGEAADAYVDHRRAQGVNLRPDPADFHRAELLLHPHEADLGRLIDGPDAGARDRLLHDVFVLLQTADWLHGYIQRMSDGPAGADVDTLIACAVEQVGWTAGRPEAG